MLGIEVSHPFRLSGSRFRGHRIEPGLYLYCGSAYGPGGLEARLSRHLKQEKPLRWHIDFLRLGGDVSFVGALEGGSECHLVDRAVQELGADLPIPGFGSSDCRTCTSHLLLVPQDKNPMALEGLSFPELTGLI